jgi:RNA recognition motif-containing protein
MDICVGNLPTDVTGSDLREVFEAFGRVETADVMKHRPGEESRGLGFVGMPARSEGVCAVLGVHGRNVNGQTITATEVQPRDPLSGACGRHGHCHSLGDVGTEGLVPRARPS